MTAMPSPPPNPEALVKALLRKARENQPKQPLAVRDRALRVAASAAVSLPVLTIATRDRVETEMLARRRADMNRLVSEQHAANVAASPEGLDG